MKRAMVVCDQCGVTVSNVVCPGIGGPTHIELLGIDRSVEPEEYERRFVLADGARLAGIHAAASGHRAYVVLVALTVEP